MAEAAVGNESLKVRVVTPEGALYEGDAGFVAAPGIDGELGVLSGHTPLISRLGTGLLRVAKGEMDTAAGERFAVRGGFLQVLGDEVTLLVTEAARAEDLNAADLDAEHAEILEALQHPESDEAYAELLARRRWTETRSKLL